MTDKPIPNYVDDQMQVFFWELDEFFPTLCIFVLFFMWDRIFWGMILSYVFVRLFSRFKSGNMSGVLFHMVWWAGIMKMNDRFSNGMDRKAAK